MLKKIAKRVNRELKAAQDYMEQAYLVKDKHPHLADTFARLSEEELVHAEKLLNEGKMIVEQSSSTLYDRKEVADMDDWKKKCIVIWEWETRLANEEITECRYKLSKYKGV